MPDTTLTLVVSPTHRIPSQLSFKLAVSFTIMLSQVLWSLRKEFQE